MRLAFPAPRLAAAWLAASTALAWTGPAAAGVRDAAPIADAVLALVQQERRDEGLAPLDRRDELDAAALERAREIAARPLAERLVSERAIDALLAERRLGPFRRVREQLHLQKNHPRPAEGAFEAWRGKRQAWRAAVGAETDAVGIAAVRSADLWLVMVAVLVEDPPTPAEIAGHEARLYERINGIRARHGLPALARSAALEEIARGHSRDMAQRGYFSHETPGGRTPAQRLRARGELYARVTENIFMTDDPHDPVALAEKSWMTSPGHRANILDREVSETGLGIALGPDGALYFTQLFREPPLERQEK